MKIARGTPEKPYSYVEGETYYFAVASRHATKGFLALFSPGDATPQQEFPLYRDGDIWHLSLEDVQLPLEYAFRFEGPQERLFQPETFLLDPSAKRLNAPCEWGAPHPPLRGLLEPQLRSIPQLGSDPSEWIVYELHVRGMTGGGGFQELSSSIPYLQNLGVTAVELLPIHAFNETTHPHFPKLCNFWGYQTVSYFAPMNAFGSLEDLQACVSAFHEAGIAVIMDVVFNHTNEGNTTSYYESFRGIDNDTYYMMHAPSDYYNYSGCGNTFNCNHPLVSPLIIESLCYWVETFGIDGFRFDLASILTRGEDGTPLETPPLLKAMQQEPRLAKTKLIAEPWDCGGLYQVGKFPPPWSEWNGTFRDSIRRFLNKQGSGEMAAKAFSGSQHLYDGRQADASVNFVTAHDGFTLYDLTAYNEKHNEANKEGNRDGETHNESWNCGVEGETDDPTIQEIRNQQMRNFFTLLLLSKGMPMLWMGDEVAFSRNGNNNAWCHDNELNYPNLDERHPLYSYVQELITIRKKHISPESKYTYQAEEGPFFQCCIDDSIHIVASGHTEPHTYTCMRSGEMNAIPPHTVVFSSA